ncbi:alpha/beta hydrolase [Nocardia australiensis]|uniref:alpha/beta hydrolase n=1 Tax=Nocardia australiensis TaxID=2887191 RepID=UPI001D15B074|nr:alpha/beta hydrolase [Nocardia australiensis]
MSTLADLLRRAVPPPQQTLRYGYQEQQLADVWLPEQTPSAVVLFLHGGFWRGAYDRHHTEPLAAALAQEGYAVANVEYRRGGEYPETFDDIARAMDSLPRLVSEGCGITTTTPIISAGHSAGGHLALWASARHRLPDTSPWYRADPALAGVLSLAGVGSIADALSNRIGGDAAAELLGAHPYTTEIDPAALGSTYIPTALVHGHQDDDVPFAYSEAHRNLLDHGGTNVHLWSIPAAGHFELIDPHTDAWRTVVDALNWLVVHSGR